jgi:phage terminase small subunit
MADEKDPEDLAPLSDQQERFCQEYVRTLHITKSAIVAGYSPTSAASSGSRLLTYAKIQARIQELMDERAKRVQVESDGILLELSRVGYSDVRGLYNDDGTVKHPTEWPTDLARAVASIEVEELFEGSGDSRTWIGYTKKVKFWPKNNALELLGKHKVLFTEHHKHSHTVTLEELVTGGASSDKKDEPSS